LRAEFIRGGSHVGRRHEDGQRAEES
jgi:hypothetical protein